MIVAKLRKIDIKYLFFLSVWLGLILRILALTLFNHDFWFDEAITYHIARLPLQSLFQADLADNNPPLYYLLIHLVLKFNQSEFVIRLPSLIFNVATIYFLYLLIRELISKRSAYLASILFLLSPLSIYLSGEARGHSLGALLVILAIYILHKVIKKASTLNITLLLLINTLGLYSHSYFILLLLPIDLMLFLNQKLRLSQKLILLILPVLLFIPWIYLFLRSVHNGCLCPNTLLSLPSAILSPAIAGVGYLTLRSYPTLGLNIFLVFFITGIIYMIFFLKGLLQNRFLSILYLLPLAVISMLGIFFQAFSPRGFTIFLPLALSITSLGFATQNTKLAFLLVVFLIITSIIQITHPAFVGDGIKASFEITQQTQAQLIAHTSLVSYYSYRFYSKDHQKNSLITSNPLEKSMLHIIGGEKTQIDKDIQTLWLINNSKWVDPQEFNSATKDIYSRFKVVKRYQVNNLSVEYLNR